MSAKKAILACLGVIVIAVIGVSLAIHLGNLLRQDGLDAFYAAPADVADLKPGAPIRVERLPEANVAGARSYRMLYRTERPDGSAAVSGAMVFVPTAPAPPGGRPVLAWAHGTVGQGGACAPSRRRDPVGANAWFAQAVAAGFVVVATDYAGLGTAGPNLYLVGRAEAADVANSVRAVNGVPDADPGDRWVVFGHSQGGHSALWTGALAQELLPEKRLLGVAAAAPAADLPAIMDVQWRTGVGWGVGAEVARSWTAAYPAVDVDAQLTPSGRRWTDAVAESCLGEGVPVPPILAFVAAGFGLPFFDGNPIDDPAVAAVAADETPRPLPSALPLLIAQGTADTVIPPGTNAALQRTWCDAGSDLTMLWLGGIGHLQAATTAAPTAIPWLRALFDGVRPVPQCAGQPPVPVTASLIDDLENLIR